MVSTSLEVSVASVVVVVPSSFDGMQNTSFASHWIMTDFSFNRHVVSIAKSEERGWGAILP